MSLTEEERYHGALFCLDRQTCPVGRKNLSVLRVRYCLLDSETILSRVPDYFRVDRGYRTMDDFQRSRQQSYALIYYK